MADESTIQAAAEFAVYRFKRVIDLFTTFLNEAAVLVLIFGLLEMYINNRLTWAVGGMVAGTAAGLFVAAISVRPIAFVVLRMMIRHSSSAIEGANRRRL